MASCDSIRSKAPARWPGSLFGLRRSRCNEACFKACVAKLFDAVSHAPRAERGTTLGTVQVRRTAWPALREKKAAFHFIPPMPLGRAAPRNPCSRLREHKQHLFQTNHISSPKQGNDLRRCIKNPSPSFLGQRETFPEFGNGSDAEYANLCNFPW